MLRLLALSLVLLAGQTAQARPGIIGTIGPASSNPRTVKAMLDRGMNVARINMAHNDKRSTRALVATLNASAAERRVPLPLLFDLPGGKVRIGSSAKGRVELAAGQRFDLKLGRRVATTARQTHVSYRELSRHVVPGDRLLLQDGELVLRVDKVANNRVQTTVVTGGTLRDRVGLTVAGKELPFANLLARDRRKLKIAVDNNASWIGVSLVQRPENLVAVRRALARMGASHVKVVAKIESVSALENLDAILDHSDMVMIARGDLRLAVGDAQLRRAEAQIARAARAKGLPLIAATNYMSHMQQRPYPSAANRKDVANAVAYGSDFLMLNETAIGRYPVRVVGALRRLLGELAPAERPARAR